MIFLGYLVNYFCLFNENMQISENRLSSCPFIFVSTRVHVFTMPINNSLLLNCTTSSAKVYVMISKLLTDS